MTTTVKTKRTASQLLKEIKQDVTQYSVLTKKAQVIQMRLWVNVYLYVEELMVTHKVTSVKAGAQALADATGRTFNACRHWYLIGKFVREKKFSPKSDAGAVRFLQGRSSRIAHATMLKATQAIKDGSGKVGAIIRMVAHDPGDAEARGAASVTRLRNRRMYNKLGMKLELMATATLMRAFFQVPEVTLTVIDQFGTRLLEAESREE